ncbi:protein NETWORKED 3A-like [Durio zibethinus]|uniref:Protein NETWORKED 3A-like n=1 Tax=Durio zibethinus TaxID=66656 RepID=A0A6P6A022_DURZI|nr:protein NETWORKED 3A-like [Durio zibethinus]XP_022758095.1 protein NETWORKED 3A-like [Durio zibethinus]
MVQMMNKMETSRWWWFDSHHNGSKRSPWLQSTLSELDTKTKAMLKLIEEDADSFAQRAEMYYKKRPELISMVEDFYRAHRSLAERYDQAKSDPGTRLITALGSPFSSTKYLSEKTPNVTDKTYDSYSETFDSEDYAESEVDDPEHETEEEVGDPEQEDKCETDIIIKDVQKEDGTRLDQEVTEEVSSEVCDEVMKLREEVERLKEENKFQKAQLMQKDEEKREVIRQLSLAVQVLKDENMVLKKSIVKESPRKWSPLEFSKLKGGLFGMLFNGSLKSHASVVAL